MSEQSANCTLTRCFLAPMNQLQGFGTKFTITNCLRDNAVGPTLDGCEMNISRAEETFFPVRSESFTAASLAPWETGELKC